MSARAELLPDRGTAAEAEDFFRSRAFYAAEGVTHTLWVQAPGAVLVAPLIVRGIPGSDLRDAISPYGYPGLVGTGATPVDPSAVNWVETGLVTIFIRERVGGEPALAGATRRSMVQVADPSLPPKSRMSDRQQIRKNEARGYATRRVAGPESTAADRVAFESVYADTMRRAGANERYMFPGSYFGALLASEGSWLFLVDAPGGSEVAAGAIVVLSDGFLHYYLSGTADEHLGNAPSKNLITAVIEFASDGGRPLNLGGGVRPGDSLETFKRGFANSELPFFTHEVVCDPEGYASLSTGREDGGFFPLYRAPAGRE